MIDEDGAMINQCKTRWFITTLLAALGLACMTLIGWMLTRERIQAVLAVIFSVACMQTKIPGIIWALTLVPAVLIYFLPRKLGYLMIGLCATGLAIALVSGGF